MSKQIEYIPAFVEHVNCEDSLCMGLTGPPACLQPKLHRPGHLLAVDNETVDGIEVGTASRQQGNQGTMPPS